jgi:hypothetical protein
MPFEPQVAIFDACVLYPFHDFPPEELHKHGMTRQPPDAFLLNLYSQFPDVVVSITANARRNLRKSGPSAMDFLQDLNRQGLTRFVDEIAKH